MNHFVCCSFFFFLSLSLYKFLRLWAYTRNQSIMLLQVESLPNELFLHGIFPYLSLIDLNYSFRMLNQRFNRLTFSFLAETRHHIYLTRDITWHEMTFIIDHVLPYLKRESMRGPRIITAYEALVKI